LLLAALGPARLSGLAGDVRTLLLSELASAGGTAFDAAETAELDGGRILAAFA
jgi:hypothetical protein